MIEKHTVGYKGMLKDLSKDKQSDKYFDAKNVRILATDKQSSLALTNEAGNELILDIPIPTFNHVNSSIDYSVNGTAKSLSYSTESSVIPRCQLEKNYTTTAGNITTNNVSGVQVIIGVEEMRDSAIVVTTDGNGWDCFWELTGINSSNFGLELKYMSDLGLSNQNLIQLLFNYENSVIQKIYFVDGKHQLRFINIRQSVANGDLYNLIDLDSSSVDTVSTFTLSQIKVNNTISGGSHTSGMIQYAYGLYILNGSQTTISPLSELVSLDKGLGLGGGEVNEVVGRSVSITVPNIDAKFTHIKIYSIKYTSYNEIPEVNIISDSEIDSTGEFSFTDTGSVGTSISLEAFTFLGSSPIIPKHIATKDNRLFAINIKEILFDIDIDTRAYSYNNLSVSNVMENVSLNESGVAEGTNTLVPANFNISPKHDSINSNYDVYKYKKDGSTLGATGKYIEVDFLQTSLNDDQATGLQFFKDREIYRIGIEFYNNRGQKSDAKWIVDMKAPDGNLNGMYNQLKVELTSEFYTWLADDSNFLSDDDKPVGFKIIRADRSMSDRTILTQGFINPMIANYSHDSKDETLNKVKTLVNSNESNKMPSVTRVFEKTVPFVGCADYNDLSFSGEFTGDPSSGRDREGFKAASSKDWRAQNWQHNRLMQMFSPEITFDDIQVDASYSLNVVGLMKRDYVANWSAETNFVTGDNHVEAKFLNGINSFTPGVTSQAIQSDPNHLMDYSFYGPTNGENLKATHQVYQSFNGGFYKNNGLSNYEIYGAPEVTNVGADYTAYNNDFGLRYANNLKTMLIDDWRETGAANKNARIQVRGANTNGAKCITFAEGPDDSSFPLDSRKSIEEIYNATNIAPSDGVLLAEFIRDESIVYLGGIYGGNSYESKSNSTYIGIGSYTPLTSTSVTIESPGDTFVDSFTFSKMAKDDVEIESMEYNVLAEIVSFKVESSIDLRNRNDLSINEWDNRWQPKYNEYQKYNKVYSQQPTLVKSVSEGSKIKKIKEFDGRIIASKEKIPGEFIDNWTDFLENETMDLDGKFGPINAITNMNDEIFVLQDSAVAHVAINPRVQTTGSDGISIELGTGRVLHDYKYITTNSGCLNQFGVISTPKGFYYVDILNHSIVKSNGSSAQGLSDAEGFHSEFINRMDHDDLSVDNQVLSTGVVCGFNSVNADVYFSFIQSTDSFTLAFNERSDAFTSFYDYIPSWYINKGKTMVTTNSDNTQVWEHFKGKANTFYGETFPSSITMHVAPEGNEIIMNGASYKQEMTLNGVELPNDSLTAVRVYNEYQDSGEVTLVMRKNMYKKFRNWTLKFPRNKDTRERVRSSWGFAEFIFDNSDGKELVLHDITLYYSKY